MIGENIQYLRKKNKLSQQALAESLNIPRTTLGDYERGNTEPNIALLLKLSECFNVSLEDLIKNDLKLEQYEIAHSDNFKILAISTDEYNRGNIELVDTKAEAGYLDSYQNPEYIKDLPKMKLPHLDSGTYRGFEISGDSMLPIESGSIVICSYVEKLNDLKDDKTYVIISKKEGLVYKRVRRNNNDNSLMLFSDNEIYLPYKISFDDIDEIWQYHAHLSFNDDRKDYGLKTESQLTEIHKKVDALHKKYC